MSIFALLIAQNPT